MTRLEFLDSVRNLCPELPAEAVEKAVDAFFLAVENNLKNGERVEIRNFGSFTLRTYANKVLRNPRTGDVVEKAVKGHIHFKVGKQMCDHLNPRGIEKKEQS
jgi:integration host factor subunit beta